MTFGRSTSCYHRDTFFVWLETAHCEAQIPAMSIDADVRDYAALLAPGRDGSLDEVDRSIAGTLPLPGTTSVDLVGSKSSYTVYDRAVLDRGAYYLESVPAGTFSLRVCVSYFRRCQYFPVDGLQASGRPIHLRRDITLRELSQAAAASYP